METEAKALEKFQKVAEKKLVKVQKGLEKYPHALPGTLRFDAANGKYQVQIQCTSCPDNSRWVFTSDLHQVSQCDKCQSAARKTKNAGKRAEEAKIRAALKASKVSEPVMA
jgi:hypothetical protein